MCGGTVIGPDDWRRTLGARSIIGNDFPFYDALFHLAIASVYTTCGTLLLMLRIYSC